jgi:hypothetical protein
MAGYLWIGLFALLIGLIFGVFFGDIDTGA